MNPHPDTDQAARHASSVREWFTAGRRAFIEQDLVNALEDLARDDRGADLPSRDRTFWNTHSGIRAEDNELTLATSRNAAARLLMDTSALSAGDVSANLGVSQSTVRHYRSSHKLYSYLAHGRIAFPSWQFTDDGGRPIPHLETVLRALPEGLHPQAVAGFFQTPQPDLRIRGTAVSAKEWLESGGPVDPVADIASALGAPY